jgi:hypothetical protein
MIYVAIFAIVLSLLFGVTVKKLAMTGLDYANTFEY